MEIDYSDGRSIEDRIRDLLEEGPQFSSESELKAFGRSESEKWAVHYHLSPVRQRLFFPFRFEGLSILEIGAGMGALSPFLVQKASHLTVIEGTHKRYSVLEKRLSAHKNWNGIVANFDEVVPEPVYDVVCVVGVLEYAQMFIRDKGSEGGPFRSFLAHARRFLKPEGVLLLAIENKLGAKYLAGAAEDHTGELFDGVTGYSQRKSPKTFSRLELLNLLRDEGFVQPKEFFPYPDYKFPEVILSAEMIDSFPEVSAGLAEPGSEGRGVPVFPLFPEELAVDTFAKAGLLKEFSNSFLWVASPNPQSKTLQYFLNEETALKKLGWRFRGTGPKGSCELFYSREGVKLQSRKDPSEKEREWPRNAVSFRTELLRAIYQKDWERGSALLEKFIREADLSEALNLSPLKTWLLEEELRYDADTKQTTNISRSTFLLRTLFELKEKLPCFFSMTPQKNVTSLYMAFCDRLQLSPEFKSDEKILEPLLGRDVLSRAEEPVEVRAWPRNPIVEWENYRVRKEEQALYQKWMRGYMPRAWRFVSSKIKLPSFGSFFQKLESGARKIWLWIKSRRVQWKMELVEFSSLNKEGEIRKFNLFPNQALPHGRWSLVRLRLEKGGKGQLLALIRNGAMPICVFKESLRAPLIVDTELLGFQVVVETAQGKASLSAFHWQLLTKPQMVWEILIKWVRAPEKLISLFSKFGTQGVKVALKSHAASQVFRAEEYPTWWKQYQVLSSGETNAMNKEIQGWKEMPKVSILVPVCDPPIKCLQELIESVQRQSYFNWELCLVDDASAHSEVREFLRTLSRSNSRVKITANKNRSGIALTTNKALEMASGELVVLLDHDDVLDETALYHVVKAFRSPHVQFVYSDEDKIDLQGRKFAPHFKPNWNPLLLCGYNYITHLAAFRTERLRKVGGLRVGFEGSQDHDLLFRYTEGLSEEQISHLPFVLYHWRVLPGSVAASHLEKEGWVQASRRAIQEHFYRVGIKGKIEEGALPYLHRVKLAAPNPLPKVSVIIGTRDKVDLLRQAITGLLEKTDYQNLEILVINNRSVEKETFSYLNELRQVSRVKVLTYDGPFNFSAMNNLGAQSASGEFLLLFNNDLSVIEPGWLTEMLSYFSLKGVGAVGAKLYYPNETVQHGGVMLGPGGVAGHCQKGFGRDNPGYFGWLFMSRYVSAVTGACLLVKKEDYDRLGGLDAVHLPVAFNDVDFCLKLREAGKKIVFTPFAELYHHESASRGSDQTYENIGRFEAEIKFMKQRWGAHLTSDPYYNPNLTVDREDFSLAFPPRVKRSFDLEDKFLKFNSQELKGDILDSPMSEVLL